MPPHRAAKRSSGSVLRLQATPSIASVPRCAAGSARAHPVRSTQPSFASRRFTSSATASRHSGSSAAGALHRLQLRHPFGRAGRDARHRPAPAAAAAVVGHAARRAAPARSPPAAAARCWCGPRARPWWSVPAPKRLISSRRTSSVKYWPTCTTSGRRSRRGTMGSRLGGGRLLRGDGAVLGHAVQHPVAPGPGGIGVAQRVVVVGRLGQGAEEAGLAHRQLVEPLVEIGLGRGGDAIGLVAQEDLVQVQLEDALLRQRLLDADRQDRLARLAHHGAVGADQHVLGDLLGDRGGAAHAPPRAVLLDIGDRGAQDAERVDAVVVPEALVLGADEGGLDALRDRLDRHEDPALGGELGQQPAVGGIDARHLRGLVVGQPAVVRQVGGDVAIQPEGGDGRRPARRSQDGEEREHPAENRGLRRRCFSRFDLPGDRAGLASGGVSKPGPRRVFKGDMTRPHTSLPYPPPAYPRRPSRWASLRTCPNRRYFHLYTSKGWGPTGIGF